MKLLALDPSSQKTGYAVLGGLAAAELIEFGHLSPHRAKDTVLERVHAMVQDAISTIGEHGVTDVVIEMTSGKVGRRRHGGGGAGLSIYGFAVGAMWAWLSAQQAARVHTVTENEWTAGVPKARRVRYVAGIYPAIAARLADMDRGGDAADAIAMGRWWLVRNGTAPVAGEVGAR